MKVIVSGGGTGGHIYPALSIANSFKVNNPDCEVTYIGTPNSLEESIVPSYGYKFVPIEVKGFQRKLSLENIKRSYKLISSISRVRKILKEEKPDIVIGTGGYVSGPVVMMAALMGIRTAIHEQNVFPGITNKLLGKKVNNVFLGFEEAKKFFDSKSNPVFVGNPVRNENFSMTKSEAREELNLKQESFILLSVGGSGGSKSLNKAIRDMIPQFVTKDLVVIHATGKFHYDTFAEGFNIEDYKENIKIYPYIENMGTYMAAADVIVCSAGAITLAEVNYLGKPSIVIPKKYTAENHQEYNAKTIENAGAGFCILEDELSAEVLREKLYSIMEDDKLRQAMEENSLSLSKENPAQLIYNILMKKSE